MNNHLLIILIITLLFFACSEEKVHLISNTPSYLPDQNYKLNLKSPDSGQYLESVTITWNETGNNVTLTDLFNNDQIPNQSVGSYTYTELTPGVFLDIEVSDGTIYTETIQIFTRTVYPVTNFEFEVETIKVGENIWNSWEEFEDEGNGIWDEGEDLEDENGDGIWNEGESFIDLGNGTWDEGEDFDDKDTTKYHRNLTWSPTLEPYENFSKYYIYRLDEPSNFKNCNCRIDSLSSLSDSTYIDSSLIVIEELGDAAFYYMVQVSTGATTRNSFIPNYTNFDPPSIVDLNISDKNSEFIEITWDPITKNNDYFYQYEIWRSSNEKSSEALILAIIPDSETDHFMDRNVGNGITWYYFIAVRDIHGDAKNSGFISGWSMP